MAKNKLTKWFPDTIKPARIGVYEAEFKEQFHEYGCSDPWYAYFDGKKWGWLCMSIENAVDYYSRYVKHRHKKLMWRGLAKNPAK